MKKSKVISMLLSVVMCMTLACACGEDINSGSSSNKPTIDTSTPENPENPENPVPPENDENKTATYSIQYYYEDKETGEYVLDDTLTITNVANVGTTIRGETKNREGYELDSDKSVLTGVLLEDGLQLSLYYKIKTFTVVFNTLGGSEIASQTITYGEKLVKPENPVKKDAKFLCWKTEDGETFDFDMPITEYIELIAEWEPETWGDIV